MATVVLGGLLGGALGGTGTTLGLVGGAVGASVGSIIDSNFILPALFPQEAPQGPKLNDQKFQGESEGAPMTYAMGTATRQAGTVIWISDIGRRRSSITVSGGIIRQSIHIHKYFISAQIAICDNRVQNIDQIWANGTLIFQSTPTGPSVSSNTIQADPLFQIGGRMGDFDSDFIAETVGSVALGGTTATIDNVNRETPIDGIPEIFTSNAPGDTTTYILESIGPGTFVSHNNWQHDITFAPGAQVAWIDNTELPFPRRVADGDRYTEFTSTNQSVDFSVFKKGQQVLVSGFTRNENNGLFTVVKARADVLRVFNDEPIVEAAGNTITISQSAIEFNANLGDITPFLGNQVTPVSFIEQAEGTGNVPAYKDHSFITVENFELENYGSVLPNFEFLIREDDTLTLGGAIARLMDRAGYDSSEYDTSSLTESFEGIGIRGLFATSQILQPIMLAYDVIAQDLNGVLTFKKRDSLVVIDLSDDEIGIFVEGETGDSIDDPVKMADVRQEDLPEIFAVNYIDPERRWQGGQQLAKNVAHPTENPQVIELPMTLSAANARATAERILWTAHANRQRVEVRIPPSRVEIKENDLVQFPAFGTTLQVLVSKVDRGDDYSLKIEGFFEDDATLAAHPAVADKPIGLPEFDPGGGTDPSHPDINIDTPGGVAINILDFAPLRNEDVSTPVVYFGLANVERNSAYDGATVYESTDDGVSYVQVSADSVAFESSIGLATTKLATANPFVWDRANSVTVELFEGALTSKTEAEVIAGANRIMIGPELVGFANATLVSDGVYTISTLLRGLRNTEDSMDSHVIGDSVFFIDDGADLLARNYGDIGRTTRFKVVHAGGDIDEIVGIEFPQVIGSVRPFAPWGASAVYDTSDNMTISWYRRSRAIGRLFGASAAPNIDISSYEIDVWDPVTDVIDRTITSTSTSASYTAAQQTTDGFTPGNAIEFRIYQLSAAYGRGLPLVVTLGGAGTPVEP